MLPKGVTTPKMTALSERLSAMGPAMLYYPILSGSQHRLHGRLIELFNSIEFNLRRSAEFLGRSKLLGRFQKKAEALRTAELIPALRAALDAMDPQVENVADAKQMLDDIDEERPMRNVLAHWVARQIPSHKAVVYFTNDNFDGKQVTGKNIPDDHVQFMIMYSEDLRQLDLFLTDRDKWLGYKTTEWHARYIS